MKPDTRSFYTRAVQAAIEHIATHLDDALELEALSRVACLSPFHFHRVFRGMVGETRSSIWARSLAVPG
jgi:AraC family transcriptional regulator